MTVYVEKERGGKLADWALQETVQTHSETTHSNSSNYRYAVRLEVY